ncbi:fimbrial protein [Pluralibacter gergoviae]
MKKIVVLFITLLLMGWSINGWSFTCKTSDGATIPPYGGSANVYVNLSPMINVGQNLVVDLTSEISCANNSAGGSIIDYVSLSQGSAYGGVLASFTGSLKYESQTYPFPLRSETHIKTYLSNNYIPWPVTLYLTPISTAGGIVINAGSLIAVLKLRQTNSRNEEVYYIWNIYAKNNVVVPTGGCDVSARDVTVTLPEYPGSMAVPVTIHCAKNQTLGYYLTGTTADSAKTIFTNTASALPAQGIGVQMKRNGNAIPTNSIISLGLVGTSPVSLGLTATYSRTNGQITAGNVQSIIGVTFVYQ